jgi:DNA-binding LytR/AlgR family response regulator
MPWLPACPQAGTYLGLTEMYVRSVWLLVRNTLLRAGNRMTLPTLEENKMEKETKANMRGLVVDDEPLAPEALTNILEGKNDVESFDCACDAGDALDKLGTREYDVLLLDASAEMAGAELAHRLRESGTTPPSVVLVPSHEEEAVADLEQHAVDYVPKPFSSEHIHNALDAAFRRTEAEKSAQPNGFLQQSPNLSVARAPRIAIKAKGRILFIDPMSVVAVQAEGNYVLLQGLTGSHLLRESISAMEEKLSIYGFIRIHRSVLVNSSLVEEIQPYVTGEYGLRVKGGKEYTVTRTYKKNLRSLAEFWIGGDKFLG